MLLLCPACKQCTAFKGKCRWGSCQSFLIWVCRSQTQAEFVNKYYLYFYMPMLMYENFVEFSQTSRKTGISVLKKLYMSESLMWLKKMCKSLSWALPMTVNNLFKFSAQNSDLAHFSASNFLAKSCP